nr:hypothetical protein [Eubacterium sp.]
MITEILIGAGVAKALYSADKASKMDEKALKKYAKAFEQSEEAELLVKKKAEYTDKRLENVAKKKRAIIKVTVPKFVEVYEKIQRIDLESTSCVDEIRYLRSETELKSIDSLAISAKQEFTDKELICGWLFKGLPKMIEMDSERFLSAAKSQMRVSNVVYSQCQSIAQVYDAIVARADRIADLLVKMNILFTKSIDETKRVIDKNGIDVKDYNEYEKGVLMTCVNIAVALSDIVNVPVVDAKGQLCESAMQMIETGEQYLKKMNKVLES